MRITRAVRDALVAISLGAATEVILVLVALLDVPRIPGSTEVMLVRGAAAWHGNERRTALVRWINMESIGPLLNALGDSGSVPAWAEPPVLPDARLVRHASLGAGWPIPAVTQSWTTDRTDVNFPPPIENETSGDAPREAARRMLASLRQDRAPTGGHGTTRILPSGFAVGTALLAFLWLVPVVAVRALRDRRQHVTPRG